MGRPKQSQNENQPHACGHKVYWPVSRIFATGNLMPLLRMQKKGDAFRRRPELNRNFPND
jgi:hypothetical protein